MARGSYETRQLAHLSSQVQSVLGSLTVPGVMLLNSGTRFTVQSGSDGAGFGNVNGSPGDRVHVVDPSVLGRTIDNPDTSRESLPASAFAFISLSEPRGNIGMNTFRKGATRNVNLSLSRDWQLWNNYEVGFRA